MSLKIIAISIAACATLTMQCCETTKITTTHTVTIRPATLTDLNAISAITHQQYQNTFKPLWTKHYAPMMPTTHNVDDFVQKKATAADINNKDFIIKQILDKNSNHKFLIAELIQGSKKTIAGYCRFEKKDPQTMYINFIVVEDSLRKQGIAKQLAHVAMHTFDDVTECQFRALVHYDFINNLYSKHDCVNKGTISLDPNTGQISTDPALPITHVDYSYTIKK